MPQSLQSIVRKLPLLLLIFLSLGSSLRAQCMLVDDDLGTNDSCATAQPLAGQGLTSGYVVSFASTDWYTITVPSGMALQIDLTYSNAGGSVFGRLYETASGCAFPVSTAFGTPTGLRTIELNSTGAPLSYTFEVYVFTGLCFDYTLDVQFLSPPQCSQPDSLEPNDTCATPSPLPIGQTNGLTVNDTAPDYYEITVPAGFDFRADIDFINDFGNLNLRLTQPGCVGAIDQSLTSSGNTERVEFMNIGASLVVILEVTLNGTGCNTYDLTTSLVPTTNPCFGSVDDFLEDNDDCGSAIVPPTNSLNGLYVSFFDLDYYSITAPPGMQLDIQALFTHANGDVQLRLFDSGSGCVTPLTGGYSATDNELVVYDNPTTAPVTLTLEVDVRFTGSCNNYDLMWNFSPSLCALPDDPLEENDDCSSAVALSPGTYPGLFTQLRNIDSDWYAISVPAGGTINVETAFVNAMGDVDMRLYDSCGGTQVGFDIGSQDIETISVLNDGLLTIDYLLEVYVGSTVNGNCNTYDLTIDIQGGGPGAIEPYCFGDGSGSICPCGNNSSPGHPGGCAHQNGDGAVLVATGIPSVAADTLNFRMTDAVTNSFGVLVSGPNVLPQSGGCVGCGNPVFDGLRCAGGGILRHGTRSTNAIGETPGGWGPPNAPVSGLISANGFTTGQVRNFFVFLRTNPMFTCQTGQNASNGVSVTILP